MERLPRKKDYDFFIDSFSKGLEKNFPKVCFFIYGSYARGTADYGRSDIDGGIIFDVDVITPKEEVLEISTLIKNSLINPSLKISLSLLDLKINQDGRFLSYGRSYTDHLKERAVIISGPDYLHDSVLLGNPLRGFQFKDDDLRSISHNLRFDRNSFLKPYDSSFGRSLTNAMTHLTGLPKKLFLLHKGELIEDREDAARVAGALFPELDLSFLEETVDILRKPGQWDRLKNKRRSKITQEKLSKTITASEELIRAYINKYPEISNREVRD